MKINQLASHVELIVTKISSGIKSIIFKTKPSIQKLKVVVDSQKGRQFCIFKNDFFKK
jgi:hypothetical protein